jgi:aryl-alcohol dehydrogenase-like predicted oxidoreductase
VVWGGVEFGLGCATIHEGVDAGVTLLDTGDFYGMGHNEMQIAAAVTDRARDKVLISVKFGAQHDPAGNWIGFDARPSAVKTALAYTLKRLGTDYVDIYRPARLDPNVPIEDTVGAIAEMVKAGYVRYSGLSEVGAATIRRAARRASHRRPADRIFPDLSRHRGLHPAGLPRAWRRHHRPRRAVARTNQRPLRLFWSWFPRHLL